MLTVANAVPTLELTFFSHQGVEKHIHAGDFTGVVRLDTGGLYL